MGTRTGLTLAGCSEDGDNDGTSLGDEVRAACLRCRPVGDSHICPFSTSLISTTFFFLLHVSLSLSLTCWPEFRVEAHFVVFLLHESLSFVLNFPDCEVENYGFFSEKKLNKTLLSHQARQAFPTPFSLVSFYWLGQGSSCVPPHPQTNFVAGGGHGMSGSRGSHCRTPFSLLLAASDPYLTSKAVTVILRQ